MVRTITLLLISNIFMTIAWYGHLKDKNIPIWKAILLSWGIAFFEYCLMVPANRYGYANGIGGFQLKIIQEVISILVFTVFAVLVLKENFRYQYILSFICLVGAVFFAFKK